jgi:phosphoglycolate phosphatase
MAKRFDLIVFDWDGTLYDSTATITHAIQAAAVDVGCAMPSKEQASYVIGMSLRGALQHAVPDLPESRYGELADRYRHHYLAKEGELNFFDGIHELLSGLRKRGFRLAIATGKSRVGLDRALAQTDARKHFELSRTADETRSKPHPQMLLEIFEASAVSAARSLMIGDTTHDLQLASNAGCASLAVSYGAHDPQSLQNQGALACLPSVAEMQDWLFSEA